MVATGTADEPGGLPVPHGADRHRLHGEPGRRHLRAADRHRSDATTRPTVVLRAHARCTPGFNYIPTRDGTLLSANITFPTDGSPGPWPVLLDYSGYDPSQPGQTPSEAAMFPYQGYVVVGLNMRGTGCSGGAFDYFEELQDLDGYDAIETLAHQTWSNGNVGMVGISYMGISQLFVAQTRPPHLRAITPLSVIADTVRSTLAPGGILNDGLRPAAGPPTATSRPSPRPTSGSRTRSRPRRSTASPPARTTSSCDCSR